MPPFSGAHAARSLAHSDQRVCLDPPAAQLFVLAPFSLLVVTLCGLINSLLYVLMLTLFVSVPHAAFHEVVELDALDALELEGLQSAVPSV